MTNFVERSFVAFPRDEWSKFGRARRVPLTVADLATLQGLNERLSLTELADVYLPLCDLITLHVESKRSVERSRADFLGLAGSRSPFLIGIAGSVAVGKSTFARVLRALLGTWPNEPAVDIVTTDGFLYPNAELERRGLMQKKGFPESYDRRRLLEFLEEVKSGSRSVTHPVYSHLKYDIVPDVVHTVREPDVLLVEGLNVLQPFLNEPPKPT